MLRITKYDEADIDNDDSILSIGFNKKTKIGNISGIVETPSPLFSPNHT